MSTSDHKPARRRLTIAITTAVAYGVIGSLWVLLSDQLVTMLAPSPEAAARLQTLKGWGYVAVTSLLLYSVLRVHVAMRERAERARRESDERYRSLVEQSQDSIYLLYERRFEFINSRFQELFGVTQEEVQAPAFDFMRLVAPRSRPLIQERERKLAAGDEVSPRYEFTALDAGGNEMPVEVSVSHLPYRDGLATQGVLRDISERRRAEEALLQRTAQLEALQEISLAITAQLDRDILLQDIVKQGCHLLGVRGGSLYLVDEATGDLEQVVNQGYTKDYTGTRLSPGEGIAGKVLESSEPMSIDDYSHWPGRAPIWADEGITASLCVPLKRGGELSGTLGFAQIGEPHTFDQQDIWLARLFAHQAAIAIENARLYEETCQQAAELGTLYDTATAAMTSVHLDDVLDRALSALKETLQPDAMAILLLEEETNELVICASMGFPGGPKLIRRSLGEGIPGSVAKTGQPVLLSDVRQDESYYACDPETRSELCVPLQVGHQVIGALNLESHRIAAFDEDDLRLISILGGSLAAIIDNAQLYEQAQREITERKRAEEELQESLAQLTTLIENLQMGVLVQDDARCVLHVNQAFCDLFGVEAPHRMIEANSAELAEISRPLFVKPEDFLRGIEERLARRKTVIGEELALVDGRTFERDYVPILIDEEERGNLWLYRDVTERRAMEQLLRQQERLAAVGQLAAGIAHDFRNLLATILLYAQMNLGRADVPLRVARDLRTIIEESKKATDLVQRLLDFSSRSMIERQPLDLLLLVTDVIERMLRPIIPEHIEIGLDIGSAGPATPFTVKADPARIQQVLTNLALNARDAMPQGGQLRFTLSREEISPDDTPPVADMAAGEYVCLTIADTGMGMAEDVEAHLFEPFFTTKDVDQGTGLGLAQVYGIVRQHDGYIDVETALGRGTRFRIYLPARQEAVEQWDEDRLAAMPRGHGETVLLVEDHKALRQAGEGILASLGYRVLVAATGREALALCQPGQGSGGACRIDLLITDLVMPHMGGKELLRELKASAPDIRALAITGYALHKEDRAELQEVGFADVVRKPFEASDLATAIRRTLDTT